MPYPNINAVIADLQLIVNHCKINNLRAGYFAALYLRMTQAVKEGIAKGIFEDGPRMEQLDVHFAARYTDAWKCFLAQQPCSPSWQYTFTSSSNTNNIVLQHLLLGINTHINLDLAIAAAAIAPGDKIDDLEKDFNAINSIIAGLFDDVQECLSQVWAPMRFLARVMNGRHEAVLNFSIDKARATSWSNAVLLANMTPDQQSKHIEAMDHLVMKLGKKIEQPGPWAIYLLKLIRKTEFDVPARTIGLIESIVM
ncbi:DUF5995 family protein [Niabella yanshanensis]|uniref:DUF5995 family protein n=1 Tax=Niabella yanshanensis TaxID=577386 RepID=A0ABZ0W4K5_9BACT|nr:DUF5995 family protein [Niabella yanshanensis]WQD38056.1 DUF5995 family protein [Niabella yanshanensis]